MPPENLTIVSTDCSSCLEGGIPRNECPQSKRECGHHCNHAWSHEHCCWCDQEVGEEPAAGGDALPKNLKFLGYADSAYQIRPHSGERTADAIPAGAPLIKIAQHEEEILVLFRRADGAVGRDTVYPEEVAPWTAPESVLGRLNWATGELL